MNEDVQTPFNGVELRCVIHNASLVCPFRRSRVLPSLSDAENRKIEVKIHFQGRSKHVPDHDHDLTHNGRSDHHHNAPLTRFFDVAQVNASARNNIVVINAFGPANSTFNRVV
jgi:hypothetical protein